MAGKGKWKKGCGVGCAVVAVLVFIAIGSVTYFVRQMSAEYKAVGRSETELIETFGKVAAYVPDNSGLPRAERVQVFIEVRGAQEEWRLNVSLAFEKFLVNKQDQESGGITHFWKLMRAATDMAPSLAGLWSSRNQALLDHGMGPGEYSYLYCLAYYSYLGYDPGDGAQDSDLDFGQSGGTGLNVSVEGEMTEAERKDAAWSRVHDLMLPLLEAADQPGASDAQWLDDLGEELELLRASPLRYPWREGAPRSLAEVFRPFRRDLELQYNLAVNPVELIFEEFETDD